MTMDTANLRLRLADAYALRDSSNAVIASLAELCRDAHDVLAHIAQADLARESTLNAAMVALRPFAHFWRQWERMPIQKLGDEFYGIHVGTPYEATLTRSYMREASDVLAKIEGVTP